jgi:tetratricopeptide (TPR) repeat protein
VTESSEPLYRAFISYSHADRACAGWLHRVLEAYRVPSKLVGRETTAGAVPRRLTPIFKDREELPASGDLSRELEAALLHSQFLIVVASPAAARSHWVDEEVRMFKQHRGESNVLVLIASGEPGMSVVPGREAEECFPRSLRFRVDSEGQVTDRPAEPVAADLRSGGDGERLVKLKLVAGLTGLKLDDLVQREAQRRVRHLTAIATFATLLAVIMTGLLVVAVRSRNEADHQRAEADGLVEYMLTDLRAKLEPVGRLDVLDSVGERAIRYYAGQRPGDLDADALGRRARALHLVGEVANLRGNLAGALRVFQQAADTTAEQLRRDPDNGQRIFDHAQSVYWVGYTAWQRGDIPTARTYFTQYRDYAQRLSELRERKPAWNDELGYANSGLGVLELGENRPETADRYFDAALRVWTRLRAAAADKREYSYSIAQETAWKADARRKMLDHRGALKLRADEIQIYKDLLAADANDTRVTSGLAVAWLRVAQLDLELGKSAAAAQAAATGLGTIKALQVKDPTNDLWLEIAVKAANMRAEALMMTNNWSEAASTNQWALARARALVATDRTVRAWRSDCLMPAQWMEIAITQARGDLGSARQKIDAFEREYRNFANPKSEEEGFARVMVYTLSGINWRAFDDEPQAIASFERAVDLLPKDPSLGGTRMAATAVFLRGLSADRQAAQTVPAAQAASPYNVRALLFHTEGRQ